MNTQHISCSTAAIPAFIARGPISTPNDEVTVRVVSSETEREALYQLRYDVYVREYGFNQPYADHQRSLIREPLDATGIVLGAYVRGEAVGTMRSNMGAGADFGAYAELHRMHTLGARYDGRVSMTTKLIVAAEHRNGRIFHQLAQAMFRIGSSRGNLVDYIDCEHRLIPMYARLGYRTTSDGPFQHPDLGPRHSMRLFADPESLRAVRSPFLRSVH